MLHASKIEQRWPLADKQPLEGLDKIAGFAVKLLHVKLAMIVLHHEECIGMHSDTAMDAKSIQKAETLCWSAMHHVVPFVLAETDMAESGFCFAAGVPLFNKERWPIGILCVLDVYPRCISDEEQDILQLLAQSAVSELEQGRVIKSPSTTALDREYGYLQFAQKLSAGLAHEIRNPLTVVKGFLQLLGNRSEYQSFSGIMIEELNRIEELANQFVILSRPISLARITRGEPAALLGQVMVGLEEKAREHHVTIELAEENCKGLYLLCEESLLVRAIRNVVQNAIEAMPDGGVVGIQCLRADDHVIIRVTDSGRGIDEQRLRYLGLPYYCTKEQGVGLGLMISSKIIQDHYGTIAIASELNRGTVVDITLPAYR